MGCGGSTESTSSTKTGDLSSVGMSYQNLLQGLLMSQLKEYGDYDIKENVVTEYSDPARATSLQSQIADYNKQIEEMDARILEASSSTPNKRQGQGMVDPKVDSLKRQKNQLQQQLNKWNKELLNIKQVTYTKYDVEKKEDPRVLNAIEKYGADSQQAIDMREEVKQEELNKVVSMANVEKSYLKNLQKMASGDYSYTDDQQKQIDNFIGPIKDVILKTTDQLLSIKESDVSDTAMREALDNIGSEIEKTGFDISSALEAAQVQVGQSEATLLGALKKANESAENKARFQFDLLSQKADQQAAQQAAMLGLPPGSSAERYQAQKIKNDALTQLQLQLSEQETAGEMGIKSQAEGQKMQISLAKVNLAESQGGKKEGLAGSRFNLEQGMFNFEADKAKRTADTQRGIIGNQGTALTAIEQSKQNMLFDAAFGNLGSMAQAAQAGMGFNFNMNKDQAGLSSALTSPIIGQLGVEQQRQFAESTTKQKTQQNPGFMDTFSSILGMGASGAAAYFSGGLAGGGGGGGGGAIMGNMQNQFNYKPGGYTSPGGFSFS